MLLGYGTLGGIIVILLAVLSLMFGGGFGVVFVLGVLGGLLGIAKSVGQDVVAFKMLSAFMFCTRDRTPLTVATEPHQALGRKCPKCGKSTDIVRDSVLRTEQC